MRSLKIAGAVVGVIVLLAAAAASYLFMQTTVYDQNIAHAASDIGVEAPALTTAIEEARSLIDAFTDDYAAPAMSVAVAYNGDVVWSEARGLADIDEGRAATVHTRFLVGSVAKPLTAAAALALAEDGALDLDADVRRYAPYWPDKGHVVTTRQLLSHQAGVRHYAARWNWHAPHAPTESAMNIQFDTTEAAIDIFAADPLEFAPDTDYSYSTYGYTLASAAMEGAAGVSFLDVMQARVFDPAGMADTIADYRDRDVGDRAREYLDVGMGGRLLRAPATNNSYKWAGGGFLSTPTDLVKFGDAMISGRLVGEEMLAQMFTPRTLPGGERNPQNYALGWRVDAFGFPRGSDREFLAPMHGGTAVGSQAGLVVVPELGISVAVASNAFIGGSGPLTQAALDIARAFDAHINPADAANDNTSQTED